MEVALHLPSAQPFLLACGSRAKRPRGIQAVAVTYLAYLLKCNLKRGE